ncbi:hypothetical protein PV433_18320 [Paenibacillus sp. GYB004]|uniref:hypothetical protein n=1 Tax=Paenibacillus sp. GYB004 TaxID=2994393 RepID=UPI002F96505A
MRLVPGTPANQLLQTQLASLRSASLSAAEVVLRQSWTSAEVSRMPANHQLLQS